MDDDTKKWVGYLARSVAFALTTVANSLVLFANYVAPDAQAADQMPDPTQVYPSGPGPSPAPGAPGNAS